MTFEESLEFFIGDDKVISITQGTWARVLAFKQKHLEDLIQVSVVNWYATKGDYLKAMRTFQRCGFSTSSAEFISSSTL